MSLWCFRVCVGLAKERILQLTSLMSPDTHSSQGELCVIVLFMVCVCVFLTSKILLASQVAYCSGKERERESKDVFACVSACVFVCVSDRERERGGVKGRERKKETEGRRERGRYSLVNSLSPSIAILNWTWST